jgi:hypothetical protein
MKNEQINYQPKIAMPIKNEQEVWKPPIWNSSKVPDKLLPDTPKPYDGYETVAEFVAARKGMEPEENPDADPETPQALKKPRKEWKWPKATKKNTEHEDDHGNPLPEDSLAMKNLSLIFEWMILRATITLNDINKALFEPVAEPLEDIDATFTSQEAKYIAACDNYINLINDFSSTQRENHDLRKKLKPGEARKSGYGVAIKSFSIEPIISEGQIRDVVLILCWNPHSSSLGVPIKH